VLQTMSSSFVYLNDIQAKTVSSQ